MSPRDLFLFELRSVNIGLVVLAIASFFYLLFSVFRQKPIFGKLATTAMMLGGVALSSALVLRAMVTGNPPWTNLFESILFFAALIVLVYLAFEWKYETRFAGVFAAPLTFILIGYGVFGLPMEFRMPGPVMPALKSNWMYIHVVAMIISYAVFTISFAIGTLYLLIEKKWLPARLVSFSGGGAAVLSGGAGSAPPTPDTQREQSLENLDDMGYRMISLGFPILGFGIICGAIWANYAWGTYWSWDPKENWALVTWLVYGAYLHVRQRGVSGRTTAIFSVVGFFVMLFTYFGVNYISEGLHSYAFFK